MKKLNEKKQNKINEKKQLMNAAKEYYKQQEIKQNPLKKDAEKQRKKDIKHKKALLNELNKQRKAKSKISKTVQETIPYTVEFSNGIFESEKGRYSIMIEFDDINYHSATDDKQNSIFNRYCSFLNQYSSNVSLQIFIYNERSNKDSLMERMNISGKNDSLDYLRKEYNEIVNHHILEGLNDLVLRKYAVLSLKAENALEAENELRILKTETIKRLDEIGLNARCIDTEERLRVMHDIFRPDYVGNFQMDLQKIKTYGLSTKDFIAPQSFKFLKNTFEIGNEYASCLYIGNWPNSLSDKFVSELTANKFDMITTININPIESSIALKTVRHQLMGMDSNIVDKQKKAIKAGFSPEMIPRKLKEAYEEGKDLLDAIQHRNQKMFNTSLMLMLKAPTKELLQKQIKVIETTAKRHVCEALKLDYMQEIAFKQAMPFALTNIPVERPFTTEAAAVLLPFNGADIFDKTSASRFYGINELTKNMIAFDRRKLKNQNGFLLGTPGAGKSMTAKWEMYMNRISTNDDIIVIDPQGEYRPLADAMAGEVIKIESKSNNFINPLDLSLECEDNNPIISKKDFMYSFFEIIKNDGTTISGIEKSIISRCIDLVYGNYDNPTLRALFETLQDQPEGEAQNLAVMLELYLDGNFSKPTNVDMNNRFTVFDISKLSNNLKQLGLLTVLEYVWKRIIYNHSVGKRTWLYIDEIYLLFQNDYSDVYTYNLWKQSRKFGCVTTGITQNVEDLLRSDNARTLLGNSEYLILLNQAYSDRQALIEILNISDELSSHVVDANPGHGLFKAGGNIVPFKNEIEKGSVLYNLMTTNMDDRISVLVHSKEQKLGKIDELKDEINKLKKDVENIEKQLKESEETV